MLIQLLQQDPQWYMFVVVTIVISIVLHELAHGWMAIRRGDDTPIQTGHMTGNPLVHMGPFSLVALFLCGIAWGQMPIDPTRMRGRYAQAMVAVAGPASNLLLAFVTLTALGLWWRSGMVQDEVLIQRNIAIFLTAFGSTNAMLCVFNLMPVPPLDGSHILANFNRGYARMLGDPAKQQIWFFAFIGAFMISSRLFGLVFKGCANYLVLIAGDAAVLQFIWP